MAILWFQTSCQPRALGIVHFVIGLLQIHPRSCADAGLQVG